MRDRPPTNCSGIVCVVGLGDVRDTCLPEHMIHASSKCGSVCLQTVMLVVPDDSSAYDVLHDPHLVDWPIPDFAEDTPLVVRSAFLCIYNFLACVSSGEYMLH